MSNFNRKINLNEIVRVKLTEEGKSIWHHYCGSNIEGDYIETELWNLWKVFGNYIGLCKDVVFEGNVLLYAEADYMKIDDGAEKMYCGNVSCEYNQAMNCNGGIAEPARCRRYKE